jgi:hypothetical protein
MVSLPVSLIAERVLSDPHVVLISIRLIPIHGHHLGVVVTLVEGFELALTRPALGMALAHITITAAAATAAATAAAGAADQFHARTVLRPFGLQGLPGDVDRCSEGGYVKSTEIRHFSLFVASTAICLIPYRCVPARKLDTVTEEVEEVKNSIS